MDKFDCEGVYNLLLNMSAGLFPKDLTQDEVELLRSEYGDDWMNELGYTEEWLRTHT